MYSSLPYIEWHCVSCLDKHPGASRERKGKWVISKLRSEVTGVKNDSWSREKGLGTGAPGNTKSWETAEAGEVGRSQVTIQGGDQWGETKRIGRSLETEQPWFLSDSVGRKFTLVSRDSCRSHRLSDAWNTLIIYQASQARSSFELPSCETFLTYLLTGERAPGGQKNKSGSGTHHQHLACYTLAEN